MARKMIKMKKTFGRLALDGTPERLALDYIKTKHFSEQTTS